MTSSDSTPPPVAGGEDSGAALGPDPPPLAGRARRSRKYAPAKRWPSGASAPSAPRWRGKRGQQVRRWLERRGRSAVRPRPAQQSPPDRLPGSSEAAAPLAFKCRSAVRNSFRWGWTPVPPPIEDLERQDGQELGPGRPETADLKRFRRPRAGSEWRTVLSPIVEAGPLGAGRRPPCGAGSSSRPRRTTS